MVNRVIEDNKDFKIGGVVLEIKIFETNCGLPFVMWFKNLFRNGIKSRTRDSSIILAYVSFENPKTMIEKEHGKDPHLFMK